MSALIKLPIVIKMTALSRSSIYFAIKNNEFPRPVQIGKRAVAWVLDEIIDYVDQQIARRNGGVK